MPILCALFGHKPDKIEGKPIIRRSGWEQDYNAAVRLVEFGHRCKRCSQLYLAGVYSEPKEP